MPSWDELFEAAAAEATGVDEFYEEYGAAPPVDPQEVAPGKGKRRRKGKGKGQGKGKTHVQQVALEELPTEIKEIEIEPYTETSLSQQSPSHQKALEKSEEDPPMQDGESFADACFAAALEHDDQERGKERRPRGRKWHWRRKL